MFNILFTASVGKSKKKQISAPIFQPKFAVDGYWCPWHGEKVCSETDLLQPAPRINLHLSKPHMIQRISVQACVHSNRFLGHTLTAGNSSVATENQLISTFTEYQGLVVYTFDVSPPIVAEYVGIHSSFEMIAIGDIMVY